MFVVRTSRGLRTALPAACLALTVAVTAACGVTPEGDWQVWLDDTRTDEAHDAFTPWPPGVPSLAFGITPYDDPAVLEDTYGPLLAYVGGRIGVPIQVVIAEDYASIERGLADGTFDAALGTPLAYVQARERDPGIYLLATQVAEGTTSYLGYVYTRADTPFETFADLAGRSFCYVDPYSTSGFVYPRAMLRQRGHDPDSFFARTEFGRNHGTCLRRVLSGAVDAAAISSGAVATARRQGLPIHLIRVVAQTPRIPYDAWIASSRLPDAAVRRLREELLALSTQSEIGRRILRGPIRLNAWIEVDDAHYDSVRAARALSNAAGPPTP